MSAKVAEVLARFPETFGLRGFPDDTFRVSAWDSFVNDDNVVMIYTERYVDGKWLAFAKGTEAELRREMVVRS